MAECSPLPFTTWPNDGTLAPYVEQRRHERRIGVCKGWGTLPQDRLAAYGGSLATGGAGRCKDYDRSKAKQRDDTNARSLILDQLKELRHEGHFDKIAETAGGEPHDHRDDVMRELQAIVGERTHAEVGLCTKLLMAAAKSSGHCGNDHSAIISHCQHLLHLQADPHYRDLHGNTALHLAATYDHVGLLLGAAPDVVGTLNWALQAPLETLIARHPPTTFHDANSSDRFAVLHAFREQAGRSPFYVMSRAIGATPCGFLSPAERAALELASTWDAVESALRGNAFSLIRSVKGLQLHLLPQPAAAAHGAMHHLLFEEVGAAAEEVRLRQLWCAMRPLLWAGCGQSPDDVLPGQESSCLELARWLLDVSKGADWMYASKDARAPYRADMALCLADLESHHGTLLDGFYAEICRARPGAQEEQYRFGGADCQWLWSIPPRDEMIPGVMELTGGCALPTLRNQLSLICQTSQTASIFSPIRSPRGLFAHGAGKRHAGGWASLQKKAGEVAAGDSKHYLFEPTQPPAWLEAKDLHGALEELKAMGAAVSVASVMEVAALAQCTSDAGRVATVFAWLHAARQRTLHDFASAKLSEAVESVLFGEGLVSMELPDHARDLSDVWQDSQAFFNFSGVTQEMPADFVCNISCRSAVYSNAAALRCAYERCSNLDWQANGAVLIRTKNGFHHENFDPRGHYRSLLLWLVVNTSSGNLVVQVELHLEAFYERQAAVLLLADCFEGVFEPPTQRASWGLLLQTLTELSLARAARRSQRTEMALCAVREALRSPELARLAADGVIQDALATAEEELPAFRLDERSLRNSHDCLDTRLSQLRGISDLHPCESISVVEGCWRLGRPAVEGLGGQALTVGELAAERRAALQRRLDPAQAQRQPQNLRSQATAHFGSGP